MTRLKTAVWWMHAAMTVWCLVLISQLRTRLATLENRQPVISVPTQTPTPPLPPLVEHGVRPWKQVEPRVFEDPPPEEARFRFPRVRYEGGNWDFNLQNGADANLTREFGRRAKMPVSTNSLSVTLVELGGYPTGRAPPVAFLSGSQQVRFSAQEAAALRAYLLENHGMIFAESGSQLFHGSIRQLMGMALPKIAAVEIPDTDPLYQAPYRLTGCPPLGAASGTRATGWKVAGRWAVVLHPAAVSDAWMNGHAGLGPNVVEAAYQLGVNVFAQAMAGYSEWRNSPKVDGQEQFSKVTDVAKPAPPAEPPPIPKPPTPPPARPVQLNHAGPAGESVPQPRTIKEALARRAEGGLVGERMKQESSVGRLGVSALDVRGMSFGAYDAAIIQAIQQRWYSLLQARPSTATSPRQAALAQLTPRGKVVIAFRMHSDGRVTNISLQESDLAGTYLSMCQQAIQDPAPYPKWPADMRRQLQADHRDVRFTFYYN